MSFPPQIDRLRSMRARSTAILPSRRVRVAAERLPDASLETEAQEAERRAAEWVGALFHATLGRLALRGYFARRRFAPGRVAHPLWRELIGRIRVAVILWRHVRWKRAAAATVIGFLNQGSFVGKLRQRLYLYRRRLGKARSLLRATVVARRHAILRAVFAMGRWEEAAAAAAAAGAAGVSRHAPADAAAEDTSPLPTGRRARFEYAYLCSDWRLYVLEPTTLAVRAAHDIPPRRRAEWGAARHRPAGGTATATGGRDASGGALPPSYSFAEGRPEAALEAALVSAIAAAAAATAAAGVSAVDGADAAVPVTLPPRAPLPFAAKRAAAAAFVARKAAARYARWAAHNAWRRAGAEQRRLAGVRARHGGCEAALAAARDGGALRFVVSKNLAGAAAKAAAAAAAPAPAVGASVVFPTAVELERELLPAARDAHRRLLAPLVRQAVFGAAAPGGAALRLVTTASVRALSRTSHTAEFHALCMGRVRAARWPAHTLYRRHAVADGWAALAAHVTASPRPRALTATVGPPVATAAAAEAGDRRRIGGSLGKTVTPERGDRAGHSVHGATGHLQRKAAARHDALAGCRPPTLVAATLADGLAGQVAARRSAAERPDPFAVLRRQLRRHGEYMAKRDNAMAAAATPAAAGDAVETGNGDEPTAGGPAAAGRSALPVRARPRSAGGAGGKPKAAKRGSTPVLKRAGDDIDAPSRGAAFRASFLRRIRGRTPPGADAAAVPYMPGGDAASGTGADLYRVPPQQSTLGGEWPPPDPSPLALREESATTGAAVLSTVTRIPTVLRRTARR